jgi:CheY-like chemotaxis protein
LLVRVLSSLIRLALESSGRSMVHLRASRGGGGALIRIGVGGRDTGAPLAAEIDLSLDRALLQCIGGEVKAFSTPHGASFDLWLATPSKGRVRALRRTSNLWVVGQQAVREAVVTLLDHEGYSLWHTGDPSEALARDPAGCDSLISELLLPRGWSGLSLSRALLAARRVPCVLVGERQPACSWPGVRFVTLPLSRVALTQALRGGATEEARVAGAAGDG